MFDLRNLKTAAPKRCAWLHDNFQLEACGDASGDVSVGFTDITGTTACS